MRTTFVYAVAAGFCLAAGTLTSLGQPVSAAGGSPLPGMAPAAKELIFRDPFTVSSYTADVSDQVATRQTGTSGGRTYLERTEHMAGEPADEFTYIDGGRLFLQVDGTTWVSPNYNFIDGPNFTLEVAIDAASANPDRTSDDWAAVVFGATSQGAFVNASDGMGILFRNNGGYQVFNGATAIYTSAAEEALPPGDVRLRIEATGGDFAGRSPSTVAFFVNDQPLKVSDTGENTYTRTAGFRGNYVTLLGYASSGNFWTYSFDDLAVNAEACVTVQPRTVTLRLGDTPPAVSVKVPEAFVPAGGSAAVTLISLTPAVAVPKGAGAAGDLRLTFTRAQLVQEVELELRGNGQARFELVTQQTACLGEPLIVTVRSSIIRNPSFEEDPHPGGVGYGTVSDWNGMSGLNRFDISGGGPFNDNGAYPDRSQVAFKQGNGIVSQEVAGLVAGKQYWLQLRYNRRDCCGGSTQNLIARFDGVELEAINGILAVGGANAYSSRSWSFTASGETGLLEIESGGDGDHTLLLDAISVVQRDTGNVTVINPSFEASGLVPGDGVIAPRPMNGWRGEGTYGVNLGGGTFADNGRVPDQDNAAFIQGVGTLSQDLLGLVSGRTYSVSVAVNARSGSQPHLRVTAGPAIVIDEDITPVGGSAAYHVRTGTFVASSGTVTLSLAQTREGDHTVLVDDVRVLGEAINIPPIESTPSSIELAVGQSGGTITVTVPAVLIAESPATVTVSSLDSSIAVPAGGSGGSLTLTFAAGGATSQTFDVRGVARGTTSLRFSNPQNVPFKTPEITVSVITSFVRNPSFEANSHPTFPGYGPIASWDSEGPGNTGVNNSGGPFHDNGVIPDRGQVALLQVEKTIRQEIVGLTAGQNYWLQFFYNTRNCCGGSIDLTARFAGEDLATFGALTPVGADMPYNVAQANFVPSTSSGFLQFVTTVAGDATALLDAVAIVRRGANDIVVINPSFEASGRVGFPGYINPQPIAGWEGFGGGRGVNVSGAGPFADNGVNPDQDSVLFLQGAGTGVRQTIGGLTSGTSYIVSVAANARTGNAPRLRISADGAILDEQSVSPVGGSQPYGRVEVSFVASSDTAVISFEQTAEGDQTVLLDDVSLRPGTVAARPRLSVSRTTSGVRIAWPSSAQGFVLQTSPTAVGPWADSALAVTVDGANLVVLDTTTDASRCYRLIRR